MKLYTVTIVSDRFDGCYSKAKWLAFHLEPCTVDIHPTQHGDVEQMEFWLPKEEPDMVMPQEERKNIGRGNTPDEAYKDLLTKLQH